MKHKFLALGLAGLFMASCSSDDDNSNNVNMSLLTTKKWYYVSDRVNGETIPYDDHETCGKDYVEFITTGTVSHVDVWNCNGNTPETETISGTYNVTSKNIVINMAGFTLGANVKRLTSETLVLESQYDYDEDGTPETVTQTYTSQP